MKYTRIFGIIFITVCLFSLQTFGQSVSETYYKELPGSSSKNLKLYTCKSGKGTCNLNGTIFMGENLLTEGKVFLFEAQRNNYTYSFSDRIYNGEFFFENMNFGNYLVYVIPELDFDFFYYPKYLPTYSGNSFRWEKSETAELSNKSVEFVMSLNSYPDPFYGNQKITGNIAYHKSYMGSKVLPIVILLLNDKKQPMDFRVVDPNNGDFSFEHLPEGRYYIHPEIAGFISQDYEVTLNEEHENIRFNIEDEQITIEKDNSDIEVDNTLYGNFLKVRLENFEDDFVVCELITLAGKSVSKKLYNSNDVQINTSDLAAGIYIVKVSSYDHNKVKTEKVYINNYD